MATRISTVLGVSPETLNGLGVFDGFIDVDSPLYVDPHLLHTSQHQEMRDGAAALDQHWRDTITVLEGIFEHGDVFWRTAVKRFTYPENIHFGLGYAMGSRHGAAVGKDKAERLVETARQIVNRGVKVPRVFELVGLFEDGVGPDLISDITIHVTQKHFYRFTERICQNLGTQTKPYTIEGREYQLPDNPSSGEYIVLLPMDVLAELPVALRWDEFDLVCLHNESLRKKVNLLIGENWKRATADNAKSKLREVVLTNPEVLKDLVAQYQAKAGSPYNFFQDLFGETLWLEAGVQMATEHPLELQATAPLTAADVLPIVRRICEQFRRVVEDCGAWRNFWTEDGRLRHERFPQNLFFVVADSYCRANNLDLSPEPNSGRGPVDFKLSSGYSARVLVEVKWSNNRGLLHGFETQLLEYQKAEVTETAIYLVIQVTPTTAAVERLQAARTDAIRNGGRTPEIVVVDGRAKASASHFEPGEG